MPSVVFHYLITSSMLGAALCQGHKSDPAVVKQATIWHNVLADAMSGPWPSRNIARGEITPPIFFSADICPTLDAAGDEMPINKHGKQRAKAIHSVGSVGKVKFVSKGSNYTGIFEGAKYGIIRISHGLEPAPGIYDPGFGMALKFLRDGVESATVVSRYRNLSQKSWNLFAEDLSNHYIGRGFLDIQHAVKNAQASPYISYVGLSNLARYGENGKRIPDTEVNFPYKLVFRPTGKISFPDEYHGDLEVDLASIDSGSVLWDVYAWDNPTELGGREEQVGSLILTSPLVPSLYGDTKLFFRHQDMRDDLKLRPEWVKFTSAHGFLFGVQSKCARDKIIF